MTGKLEGRAALVTGAATGIGLETAKVLALHGARVALADIQSEGVRAAAEVIRSDGGEACAIEADVADEDQARAMVGRTVEAFGRIDILHNNAAAQDDHQRAGDRDVCSLEAEFWDRAMAVNVRGPMLACKYAIPHMIGQGGGAIIHSASGLGVQGELTLTSYGASKAALIILSKYIAAQYGKQGVRSNVIAIGFVLTDTARSTTPQAIKDIILASHLTPYLGEPRHIADAVAFLASDEAAFITGHTLAVDGGFTSHSPTLAQLRAFFDEAGSNKL